MLFSYTFSYIFVCTGCHLMVPPSWDLIGMQDIRPTCGHVGRGCHPSRDGYQETSLSRGLWSRRNFQNIPVAKYEIIGDVWWLHWAGLICDFLLRVLGTPNEDTWPGVSCLQDWNESFPGWPSLQLCNFCGDLCDEGVDLVEVRNYCMMHIHNI